VKDISQTVWAGIWLGGRTKLVVLNGDYSKGKKAGYTTNSYIEALENKLVKPYTPDMVFQQEILVLIIHLLSMNIYWSSIFHKHCHSGRDLLKGTLSGSTISL